VICVGDDWAEDHHDVHVMDEAGARLASRRLPEGLEGIRDFHELVADLVEEPANVVIGIETDRGLWVHALTAAGYRVYAINPLAVSRCRDRHNVAGAKSDGPLQGSPPLPLASAATTPRPTFRWCMCAWRWFRRRWPNTRFR
jgi:hypothetical protein